MPVAMTFKFLCELFELPNTTLDLGVRRPETHVLKYPGPLRPSGRYASGTQNNQQDRVFTDRRTVVAGTPDSLDLSGTLAGLYGTTSFVEVRGLVFINRSTSAKLEIGGGSNSAWSGLFKANGDIIIVPPSGLWVWTSPLDGQGLQITGGTGDLLQVVSASGSIEYDVGIWGVSS